MFCVILNLKALNEFKFRFDASSRGRRFERFPIVVNDEPAFTPPAKLRVPETLPSIALYGTYPYNYYQHDRYHPEEPVFISVTPRPKFTNKTNQGKLSTSNRLPKDKMKLVDARSRPEKLKQALKMDIKFIKAVQQPNSKFVVEKFFLVPGKRAPVSAKTAPAASAIRSNTRKTEKALKSQKLKLRKQIVDDEEIETATVKVESFGRSAADQPIPDYSAFFPRSTFTQAGKGEESTLILEPISKAISGNDGTSISSPISRAILRRDSSVKVLFRPQSVAITGANGIAHAQADLLLDFIEDE